MAKSKMTAEQAKDFLYNTLGKRGFIAVRSGTSRERGQKIRKFWIVREQLTGGEAKISGKCRSEEAAWNSAVAKARPTEKKSNGV